MPPQDILNRLEAKLDKLDERFDVANITLARQADQLGEHMRRTELLEGRVAPLEKAHAMWSGVGKALAILGTAGGVFAGLLKALG